MGDENPSIKTIGGQTMLVKDKCITTISNSTRKNKQVTIIFYILEVKTNLFLVGKLVDLGYLIFFNSKRCYIYAWEDSSKIYLEAIQANYKLYKIKRNSTLLHAVESSMPILLIKQFGTTTKCKPL